VTTPMAIEDGTTTTVGSSDLDLKCEIIDENPSSIAESRHLRQRSARSWKGAK
jgi:hypothetical protein